MMQSNGIGLNGSIKSHRQFLLRLGQILPCTPSKPVRTALRREKPNTWRHLRAAGGVFRPTQATFEPTLLAPARQMTCGFGAPCADVDNLRTRRGFISFAYC